MIIRLVDLKNNNIKLLLEDNPTPHKVFLPLILVLKEKLLPTIFVFLYHFRTLKCIRFDARNNFPIESNASHCDQQMANLQKLVLKRLNFFYKYL